ncbi:MAG: molybdate ABC transporter permease subunit [Rhodospirillales bacterium]|nr:molybdate ABC transporter permease subunit [Rhodospirillales bacterium]
MNVLTAMEMDAIALSLRVSSVAVVASLPFGILVAWILARCRFPGRAVLDAIVHLPLVLPPVVVGYMLLVAFGRRGLIGEFLNDTFGISIAFSWQGAAIAGSVMAFPLMVRAIRLSIESIDTGLEQAARTLGSPPWRVFLTVTLPLSFPGLLTGCLLAFARSLGEFGATVAFVSNIPGETQTMPLALYALINTPGGEQGALRLVIAAVALSFAALLVSEFLARRLSNRHEA